MIGRTRFGTSHFVSRQAAYSYYADMHISKESVRLKIKCKDIHIGKPRLSPGERLYTIDEGRRYAIESSS